MLKIIHNNLRLALRTSQVRSNLLLHLWLIFGALSTHSIGLDVLIEKFVRIQLWAVTRQIEQPDMSPIPIYAAFDFFGTMGRIASPQSKGKFELVGAPIGNQADSSGRLVSGQTQLTFGAAFVSL